MEVQTMSIVRRTSPFGEMLSLRQAMDRLFEESIVRPRSLIFESAESPWLPLDVHATNDALVVEAALPGVKPEDVEITVSGDTLTISGTSSSDSRREERGYLMREIRRGSFSRTVTLPADLRSEAATANFENGMLRLSIPKAEAAKPRQIRISPTTESAGPAEAATSEDIEIRERVGATADDGS
jgi:HSP20 family protein